MSELNAIEAALHRAAQRCRLDRALRGLWRGLLVASILWLVALVAYKVFPLPAFSLAVAGGVGLLCMALGAIIGGWRKISSRETARWVDVKQNLKERLSTALEVTESGSGEEWKTLLVHDAAQHVQGLDAKKLLPLHLPKVARWALLVLLVVAGLGFIPEYRSKQYVQKRADAANIKDTGKQLAALTKRSLETKRPELEQTQKALEKVEEAGQQLQKISLTKSEALKQLTSAREKVAQEMKELERDGALKPLERAAREQSSGSGAQPPDALQKQIDALQKSLGGAAQDPDKLNKFQQDIAQAQQLAANLPDKNSPEGKAAREKLSQMMSNLAQQMKDAGMPTEGIEDALKALQQGNIDQFAKDMNFTANDLQKLSDMAKQLQSLQQQQANAKMGKDLAEQLKNAQTDAAQKTLEKMVSQMKSGQMSKEELDKILNEVSKALNPASEYGKVAEHLKNAVKQMQQCQNPGNSDGQKQQAQSSAAQSLSDAAKELAKLAQQMADAEQLAQMMEALERAQQAISSGKGWGQCNGSGKCPYCDGKGCFICLKKGGSGKGGLNAAGVGTWAEETGWIYYPKDVPQTPVDNSRVVRPDQDPRGITERDATLNDALKPTKVKGQLSPGGQMPSITLKGVAIKGQSKVQFEEAATSAQTEAQSALNQDQVPRAYRGAVHDYFDDLKK
jgi:hypothetical protein